MADVRSVVTGVIHFIWIGDKAITTTSITSISTKIN